MSSSSKPSQYPLLGFKDRHLEDDYLEYLVVASRARIILGYVTAILLYASGPFTTLWIPFDVFVLWQETYNTFSDEEKKESRTDSQKATWTDTFPNSVAWTYSLLCLVLLMFIFGGCLKLLCWYLLIPSDSLLHSRSFDFFAGLVAVVCMYQMKRFEKYRTWIFYITPAIYLLYMAHAAFMFTFSNQGMRDTFGDMSWIVM